MHVRSGSGGCDAGQLGVDPIASLRAVVWQAVPPFCLRSSCCGVVLLLAGLCALPAALSQSPGTPNKAAPSTRTSQDAAAARKASESNAPASKPAQQGTTAQGSKATTDAPTAEAPSLPTVPGKTIDQVVAIVNGHLVLDSDVDEERRFENFQTYLAPAGGYSRDRAIERLINRDLILQQSELQAGDSISEEDVAKQIDNLRKEIPACKEMHCETKAGWDKFLAQHGFTEASFALRWKQRMQVLAFIEQRFRSGISITPSDIKSYYTSNFVPAYEREGTAKPPSLEAVSTRIQDLLLQQQVSALLSDWLRSLRAQGGVVVLHPGEDAP